MEKILSPQQAILLSKQLHQEGKKIILLGGCFDILHIGHIGFLEQAKKSGDTLFVLLENDATIKKLKGEKRPINSQMDRAKILAALAMVDIIVLLPPNPDNTSYDDLVIQIKPAIIATTQGDPNRHHKERQAKLVKGKVIDVVGPIENQSTTRILTVLNEL